MTAYVIIHATVDDTETHHREIVPKIMRMVERHGGKRIALGHGEQLHTLADLTIISAPAI